MHVGVQLLPSESLLVRGVVGNEQFLSQKTERRNGKICQTQRNPNGVPCSAVTMPDWAMSQRRHGVPETAAADGAAILRQQCYRRMVANYRSVLHDDPAAAVRAGLERLAFGRSNDAIGLLLAEEPPGAAAVQALDLFPVSSVKRDKNGGMEIHFFDRLKALTALYEYGGDADGKAAAHALLTALSGREAVDSDAED